MRKDITNVVFDFGGVIAPAQVLFIDDGSGNVEAARNVGVNTIHATNGEVLTIMVSYKVGGM